MNDVYVEIKVDFSCTRSLSTACMKQFEKNGRNIRVYLYDGGEPYELSGLEAAFLNANVDGTVTAYQLVCATYQDCNYIDVPQTSDLTELAGTEHCEIQIKQSGDILCTATFDIIVEASPATSEQPGILKTVELAGTLADHDRRITSVETQIEVSERQPNLEQMCSIPLVYVRDKGSFTDHKGENYSRNQNYPSSLQTIMFADSTKPFTDSNNALIMLRVSAKNTKVEAVVLKYSEQTQGAGDNETVTNIIHRYDLDESIDPTIEIETDPEEISNNSNLQSSSPAGHANSAVLVGDKIYIATGNIGARGIAIYSYPGFVYQGKCIWEDHIFWSVAYDSVNKIFYLAESGSPYTVYSVSESNMTASDSYKSSDTLTEAFQYPAFFDSYKPYASTAAFKANSGTLAYHDGIFYVAAHDPNALVRFKVKNGVAYIIDVSEIDHKLGELEHVAFCGGKIYAATQIGFYSMKLNNVYEVSYDHTKGTTQPCISETDIYVNQRYESVDITPRANNTTKHRTETADYSYIARKGTFRYPYCCIEEAMYYRNHTITDGIRLLSNIMPTSISGLNVRLIGENISVTPNTVEYPYCTALTLDNSNVYFLHTNLKCTSAKPALTMNSCDIVFASDDMEIIRESGDYLYDVQGSGDLHTNIAVTASLTGTISGKGVRTSTNARFMTKGYVAAKKGYGTLSLLADNWEIGDYYFITVEHNGNTKQFFWDYSSLFNADLSTKTITQYDTFFYTSNNNKVFGHAVYTITSSGTVTSGTSSVESLSVGVSITIKDTSGTTVETVPLPRVYLMVYQ